MTPPDRNSAGQPVARLRLPSGEHLLYPGQQVRLGRGAENEIAIADSRISRSHATIRWDGSEFVLQDLGSSNGTYLNGTRLDGASHVLLHGDQISLGRHALVFELVSTQLVAESAAGSSASSGRTGPRLIVVDGLDLGREYPLWGESIVIGRDSREATWEIRLTDRSVSRPHARLELAEAGYYLVDLESANGTHLNDQPVSGPVLVKDGDVIMVGGTRLAFHA